MRNIALIIIDMQNAYFVNAPLKSQRTTLTKNINALTRLVLQADGKVFNVRTEHAEDTSTWTLNMIRDQQGFLFKGSKEAKTVSELKVDDAIDVVKTRDSAFYNTTLKDSLQKFNVDTIIMCGVSTHTCITQSAADAYAADIHVILAKDAIADDTPDFHEISLKQLQKDYRQEVLANDDIINNYLLTTSH